MAAPGGQVAGLAGEQRYQSRSSVRPYASSPAAPPQLLSDALGGQCMHATNSRDHASHECKCSDAAPCGACSQCRGDRTPPAGERAGGGATDRAPENFSVSVRHGVGGPSSALASCLHCSGAPTPLPGPPPSTMPSSSPSCCPPAAHDEIENMCFSAWDRLITGSSPERAVLRWSNSACGPCGKLSAGRRTGVGFGLQRGRRKVPGSAAAGLHMFGQGAGCVALCPKAKRDSGAGRLLSLFCQPYTVDMASAQFYKDDITLLGGLRRRDAARCCCSRTNAGSAGGGPLLHPAPGHGRRDGALAGHEGHAAVHAHASWRGVKGPHSGAGGVVGGGRGALCSWPIQTAADGCSC